LKAWRNKEESGACTQADSSRAISTLSETLHEHKHDEKTESPYLLSVFKYSTKDFSEKRGAKMRGMSLRQYRVEAERREAIIVG
jgi:hypothetical protein